MFFLSFIACHKPLTSKICFLFWVSNIAILGGLGYYPNTFMQFKITNSDPRERENGISDFFYSSFNYYDYLNTSALNGLWTYNLILHLVFMGKDRSFDLEIMASNSNYIRLRSISPFLNPCTTPIYELFIISSASFRYSQTTQLKREFSLHRV